ncbi:MAG: hypothetical protein JXR23_04765 [Pontiellaceae bacterium]|nr:hypothetical protein [Pontiellaceae bacterium]
MKKGIMIAVAGLGLMLAGCASKPSFSGVWRCEKMPPEAMEEGVVATQLVLAEEGAFSGYFEMEDGSPMGGFSGNWLTNGTGGIDFMVDESSGGPEKGTGLLMDEDTLLGSADGITLTFTRQ